MFINKKPGSRVPKSRFPAYHHKVQLNDQRTTSFRVVC